MKQQEFREHVYNCLAKAEQLFEVKFGRVNITFDLKGYCAGIAWSKLTKNNLKIYGIRFNKEAIDLNTQDMVNSTIPHEVAHLVCFAKPDLKSVGHDWKWKRVAIMLGDVNKGAVYHTMKLQSARKKS